MQTVTVPIKTFENILAKLDLLAEQMTTMNEKLQGSPSYGSDAWWEWSEKKACEDIRSGRYTTLQSKKELQEYLSSLKTAS